MNDRELLELAAKAAGVGGGWGDRFEYHNGAVDLSDMWILDRDEFCPWNPLVDDGDALRLAVKLGMRVSVNRDPAGFTAIASIQSAFGAKSAVEVADKETLSEATRRAIVRAAAEIGKSL